MSIDNHALTLEFPQLKERIHALKVSDHKFAKLMDEYNDLDREIRRLEGQNSPKADETMEDLKLKRLTLKDTLYGMLKA